MKTTFVINTSRGLVARFNASNQSVSIARNAEWVKLFRSEKAAMDWGNKYANAGYGLTDFTVDLATPELMRSCAALFEKNFQ